MSSQGPSRDRMQYLHRRFDELRSEVDYVIRNRLVIGVRHLIPGVTESLPLLPFHSRLSVFRSRTHQFRKLHRLDERRVETVEADERTL